MFKLKYKIWIDQNGKAFGQGPYKLLEGIKETGSLSQSAKALNMSYSQAHSMMKNLGQKLGFPLIKSQTGGLGGGRTEITPEAQELLDLYGNFYHDCEQALEDLFYEYFCANKELLQEDSLINAFGIGNQGIVVFVGGGGKTSLMWHLAEELVKKNRKVLVTTTTHILPPQEKNIALCITDELDKGITAIQKKLKNGQILTLGTGYQGEKMVGVPVDWINALSDYADYILIEGDGAKRLPFKAPAEHEPVIPKEATTVVSVVGMDVLGKPLSDENVFRGELVSRISGTPLGEAVSVDTIASVVVSSEGSRKNVPPHARWVVCLNKVDNLERLQSADLVAKYILAKQPFVPVIATCTLKENIIAGRWQN